MRHALGSGQNPVVCTGLLVNLVKIVLENNVFKFDGKACKQKLGTAVGTKFAPSQAYLFMVEFERKLWEGGADTLLVWSRYIDDVFLIWTRGNVNWTVS